MTEPAAHPAAHPAAPPARNELTTLTWVCGPDVGATYVLGHGTYVIGRALVADVRCDDPTLEPFHAQLTLTSGEPPSWVQLSGRSPLRHGAGWVEIGASRLEIAPAAIGVGSPRSPALGVEPVPARSSPARSTTYVIRRPRIVPTTSVDPAAVPAILTRSKSDDRSLSSPGSGAIVPAMITMAVGVAVGVGIGQPMFAVMGAIGFTIALATFVVGRVTGWRRRRQRARAVLDAIADLAEQVSQRRQTMEELLRRARPGLVGALDVVQTCPDQLWCRRPHHPDAYSAVVGIGSLDWDPGIEAYAAVRLGEVPITIELAPASRVAIVGPNADALIRSIVIQLAATTGPADWQLVVVSDRPDRWQWAGGLPPLFAADESLSFDEAALADLASDGTALVGRHVVIVTDRPEALALRTGALRRLLHLFPDAALVVEVGRSVESVPALCRTVVTTTSAGAARVALDSSVDVEPVAARMAGLGVQAAIQAAGALSMWSDPDAADDEQRSIPAMVDLAELLRDRDGILDRETLLRRWRDDGHDVRPRTPIGIAADGVVDLDLVRDGPHGLIAGTTGSGKSELLRSLVLGMCASTAPDQVNFVLVDFKGGATFDGLAELAHVVGVVTDLDHRLAERMLHSLRAEVVSREQLIRTHASSDLGSLRAARRAPMLARLIVVVDEFAALAVDQPDLLHALIDVARRGRSLGVHLLLATQRPSGVVSDEIRTNTELRIALRVLDSADALDVVGDITPASLRRTNPGRTVMRLGPSDLVTFQAACCADAAPLVRMINEAAEAFAGVVPKRPWCDPLPESLKVDDLPPKALGLIDQPDQQRQSALFWIPADGHVLVVGSRGSGVSSTLASVAVRSMSDDAELVVIDGLGDARWDEVADHPRCAGVVRPHERERLLRLLKRAAASAPPGGRIIVIDGVGALRRELEPVARLVEYELFEALVAEPPPGVTFVFGNDGGVGLGSGLVARFAHRWLLHLHDAGEAGIVGLRAVHNPPAIAGRMVDAATASEVQLLGWPYWNITGDQVQRLATLSPLVAASDLAASSHDDHVWIPAVGIGFESLSSASLEVADGDHLLVVGPPRSGRSHALMRLAACWRDVHRDGAIVVVVPRRSPLGDVMGRVGDVDAAVADVRHELSNDRAVLLVIDDAELVTDPSGRLAALLAEPPDGFVVVAAGRADALRAAYGHWSATLRRSRRGIVMAAAHDADADLLAAVLPRSRPIPARPGLCWLIGDGDPELVQLAMVQPNALDQTGARRGSEVGSYRGGR